MTLNAGIIKLSTKYESTKYNSPVNLVSIDIFRRQILWSIDIFICWHWCWCWYWRGYWLFWANIDYIELMLMSILIFISIPLLISVLILMLALILISRSILISIDVDTDVDFEIDFDIGTNVDVDFGCGFIFILMVLLCWLFVGIIQSANRAKEIVKSGFRLLIIICTGVCALRPWSRCWWWIAEK